MRLKRFEILNFKAIQHLVIDWDELIVLIGENNSGKSCVLLALNQFLSGSAIKDSSLFHRFETDENHAIEMVGHFDQLTAEEREQAAVKGRMNGEEWILKKKYWLEENGTAEKAAWKEMLYSFSSPETFDRWPAQDTSWNAFPTDYQPLIQQIQDRGARPSNESREALRALVRTQRPDLVRHANPTWVPNPGGGGNWKSNANSIIPRPIYVRAVHEASEETDSKDASTYGKLIGLIVERQLAQRDEVAQLRNAIDAVLQLFCPDPAHPERQADEIRQLQGRITRGLEEVIGGKALIKTEPPEVREFLLPSTTLVIRDEQSGIETDVASQGHGLQRTLIMTLLQLLAEVQEQTLGAAPQNSRPTLLLVEEPELYMHPQMERRVRDVLYRLASQTGTQVACCTHSPVFLDIAHKYKSIVRLTKADDGRISRSQVTRDLFLGPENQADKERLQTVSRFNPSVNELFFSSQVVLFEEFSAIAAFDRAAELSGLFERHPRLRREVSAVDCGGKCNIPAFQKVINAFGLPYRIVHDEDRSNAGEFARNATIAGLAGQATPRAAVHFMSPDSLESMLGYTAPKSGSKPFAAVKKVEELHAARRLPEHFLQAMNFVYFGTMIEPPQTGTEQALAAGAHA